MTKENPVLEAKRYVDNARSILREKAFKEKDLYTDRKYVKLAGYAAYTGALVLGNFVNAYELLHLYMGCDGTQDVIAAQRGLKRADEMIQWVEQRTATC